MGTIADEKQVKKVIGHFGVNEIAKETGIKVTTVSRYNTGKTAITNMSLKNAILITEFANKRGL